MGTEAPRRHGPRSSLLLLWPRRSAGPHHLWQCAVPTHGNDAAPEALYRVGGFDQSSFDPGLTSFSLPFIPLLTAHSTSHHGAGGCSNGSNFLITGWRYVRSESSWSKVVYVTHVTQCIDGKDVLAVYEAGQASRDYSALLTIRHAGLAVVTEIVTTLMLSQMAIVMQWQN